MGLRLHGGAHQLCVPGPCGAARRRGDRRDAAKPAVGTLRNITAHLHRHNFNKEKDMATSQKPLHIDIPVRLTALRIAFSIADLAFEGDLPASICHLQLIANDIADWKAEAQVIAVFHTNAGHVTLHDDAYNAERNVATSNPYKQLLVGLMKRGVEVELCGATAVVHKWGNGDLLPGIKFNTDAMARMSQLVQEGFVQITEWD